MSGKMTTSLLTLQKVEGSIVIVWIWRRRRQRQLLSCEPGTSSSTTMTTHGMLQAHAWTNESYQLETSYLGVTRDIKKLRIQKARKKCKGEEASIARAHQPQAHTSTGLNHLCILSFSNNPSTQLSSSNSLNPDCLILKSQSFYLIIISSMSCKEFFCTLNWV